MTRTRTTAAPLLGMAALAALGLASPPAAHAQSLVLNSGDVVTVSGAGTHGTIGGTAVNNNTTSYNDSTSGSFYGVETNGTATFTLGAGGILSAPNGNDAGLFVNGSGLTTITGGTLSGTNSGLATSTTSTGTTTISGGSFTGGTSGNGLITLGSGPVTITGGTFAGGGYGLRANPGSRIDLYGMFNGLTPGQTQTFASNGSTGMFTGTLTNNTASQTFTYQNYGTITLHNTAAAAPEPSQAAALSLGVLGLCALALRARKRRAA